MFIPGKDIRMLTQVGIKYGYLFVEGGEPFLVASLEEAVRVAEALGVDDADKEAITSFAFLATQKDLFAAFLRQPRDLDNLAGFVTVACDCDELPLRHCEVIRHGQSVCQPIWTLHEGFFWLLNQTNTGVMPVSDGIALLKKMIEVGLVADDLAWKKLFLRLPLGDQMRFWRKLPLESVKSLAPHQPHFPLTIAIQSARRR